jgi:Calx-beta domain/FG-GAP-like repeat
VQLFRASGDGTFQSPATLSGETATRVVSGDLNADGNLDVVTGREILLGNGDGTFRAPIAINLLPQIPSGYHSPLAQQPTSVAVGDLNADGKLDLVVTGRSSISVYTGNGLYGPYYDTFSSGQVNVLLGNGDGSVSGGAILDYPDVSGPGDVLDLVDLNHDGHLDLISLPDGFSVARRFMGDGSGSLSAPTSFDVGGRATGPLLLGDFNHDTHLDLVTQHYSEQLRLTLGRGDGTFENPMPIGPQALWPDYPRSVAVGDINGDGHLDVAYTIERTEITEYGIDDWGYSIPIAGLAHAEANIILGSGAGTFRAPIVCPLWSKDVDLRFGSYDPRHSSLLADFNGDGRLDLAVTNLQLGLLKIALNDGDWQPPPSLSIGDATIVEGTGGTRNAVFTVTLDIPPTSSVSVEFATQDNGAVAGLDYTATGGTLTFGPGVTSRTISVPILDDTLDEYDERFNVTLANSVGIVMLNGSAMGTILDDDAAPQVTISDVSKAEGNQGLTLFQFTVSLSAPSGKSVQVNYAVANGTANRASGDYRADTGTVYITPGQTTAATIYVWVLGDTKKEAHETFFVNISNAVNGTITDAQGLGTILNDDAGGGGGKGASRRDSLVDMLLADDVPTTTRKRK